MKEIEYDQLPQKEKKRFMEAIIKELEKDHIKMGLKPPGLFQKEEMINRRVSGMVFFDCNTIYYYADMVKI